MNETQRHIDPYDTGQWHLTAYFSRHRAFASLRHLTDPAVPRRVLFDTRWNAEGGELLKKTESIVYENPAVLDDYSADIVIAAQDTLFIPASIDDECAAEKCYAAVYRNADPDDIITEKDDDLQAISVGAPGLKAFLGRTFPGTRTGSQAMALMRKFRNYPGGGTRIYLHLEDGECLTMALDGRRLLCCATHDTPTAADALYAAMLTINAYSLNPETTEVFVSGDHKTRGELATMLRRHISCVMHTMLPSGLDESLPLAAALAELRAINKSEK